MDTIDKNTHPTDDNDQEGNNVYDYQDDFQTQLENFERREKRKAQIGNLVFSLRKSINKITAAKDIPLTDMMENNARALNAAFEYYMDNACKSPEGDRKIALALRAHAQMVRAIHTLERLRTSKMKERTRQNAAMD